MKVITIGVVDYGMGNHASVVHTLRSLGFRVRISGLASELDGVDILFLPGVGAFPAAMRELHQRGLVSYLREQAALRRPIVGICLGMQLLASTSDEHGYTEGLGLIPGEIVPFDNGGWHIGWNTLNCPGGDALVRGSDMQAFYFNHAFYYRGMAEFQIARVSNGLTFAAIIRRGSVVGLQFHPEKSQTAGRVLLQSLMTELANA
ncbi:imidazole glycerol phosphate synthase subunit HisH [Herbaspirillum sp. NPDC101397]|uniref:imidazole glycerol phosphate synthase subunit HisH n=1 Tax=Herbaspirillum sp. NPDC101397 TaxID=3364006 RepID=UPI00383BC5FB